MDFPDQCYFRPCSMLNQILYVCFCSESFESLKQQPLQVIEAIQRIIKKKLNQAIMNFSKLVPSVFYVDISDGKKLFVDCLQFSIEHEDLKTSQPYCVLEKDGIRIMVFQDEQLANEHYPELRLETENIDEVYAKVSATHPHLLHPNLNKTTTRPWGAKEFAIKDNQVGIRFQQW